MDFPVSEHVANQARRLIRERRVRLIYGDVQPGHYFGSTGVIGAMVIGREDDYAVHFHPEGVTCDCWAGSDHGPTEPRCSHAVAAMIVAHEET